MKRIKFISALLACVMLFSAFGLSAAASDITVNFVPVSENGTIYGIALKTPQNVFRSMFGGRGIDIYDCDGVKLDVNSEVYMGTGFTVKVEGRFYSVVVMGDINGDGELTSRDYLLIKRACLGTYGVSALAKEAAGVERRDELRPINYIKVKRAYFGTYEINKKYTCDPYNPNEGGGWSDGWI